MRNWGKGKEVCGLERFRVGDAVRRAERILRYWGSLEACCALGVLIGTTVGHLF